MHHSLAGGVTASVVFAVGAASVLFVRHHEQHAIEQARSSAEVHSNLIQLALEHQMIEDERELVRKMVVGFGQDRGVRDVMVLDRRGKVQMSARPHDRPFARDDRTCAVCHDHPSQARATTALLEIEGGQVLRSVRPIHNTPVCHECHPPKHRINGVLIVDFDIGHVRAGLTHEISIFAVGGIALALFLIGAVAWVVRATVTRRLSAVLAGARRMTGGDLKHRIAEGGGDTVEWLAGAFNGLAATSDALVTQVRDKRQQLEDILNGVDDGIVVLDDRLQVVIANQAFLDRHDAPRATTIGHSCLRLGEGICDAGACPARQSFLRGVHTTSVLSARGRDGKLRFEEVRGSPLRGADGEVTHVVEVWRDITERRMAEARMADGHRLASLGLLASGFSHELNTPLGTVLACVDGIRALLREPAGDRDDIETYAQLARDELLRCRGITQQFLAFSRGGSAGQEPVDLCRAARSVARLVGPTARDRGVAIDAQVDEAPVFARIGEGPLQQVLINLVLNAVQACARDGHVTISLSKGGGARLTVRDDGRGIGAEEVGHIFEPFYSGHSGGTGLGLFLALDAARR